MRFSMTTPIHPPALKGVGEEEALSCALVRRLQARSTLSYVPVNRTETMYRFPQVRTHHGKDEAYRTARSSASKWNAII